MRWEEARVNVTINVTTQWEHVTVAVTQSNNQAASTDKDKANKGIDCYLPLSAVCLQEEGDEMRGDKRGGDTVLYVLSHRK